MEAANRFKLRKFFQNSIFVPNGRRYSGVFFCGIFLFIFLLGIFLPLSHAYYQASETPKNTFFQKEKNYVPWGDKERSFALYDNFGHFSARQAPGSLLCPFADEFIPIDEIRWNHPLRISIRRPLSLENSLANMLYANLKLKKLVEEYVALQNRARLIMEAVGEGRRGTRSARNGLSGIENFSVHHRVERLNLETQIMQRNVQSGGGAIQDAITLSNVESLRSLMARQNRSQSAPLALFLTQQGEEVRERGGVSGEPANAMGPESLQGGPVEKTPLPWIFQEFLDLLKYFLTHKIEGLLYLSLIFIFLVFLLSARNR